MKRNSLFLRACVLIAASAIGSLLLLMTTPWRPLAFGQNGSGESSSNSNKSTLRKPPPKTTPKTTPKTPPKKAVPRQTAPQQTAPQIEMVKIPAGTFMMGSPDGEGKDDEHPQHRVTMQSFYMGKYEVTQAQWQAVMGNNPSAFKGDNLPVEQVSWNDAQEFINKLNEMQSRYTYRLPSEAEWEYAARAGTTGDYAGRLDDMAWYEVGSVKKTHAVGTKRENAWGLYDMHGNVWEWCEDYQHADYNGAPADGSSWVSGGDATYRVVRGGSWSSDASLSRLAYRGFMPLDERLNDSGLRLVAFARN